MTFERYYHSWTFGLRTSLIENRVQIRLELENVSTAHALQLQAGRRRSVQIRFYTSPVASLKSLSLSVAVLERFYCWYTLRYAVTFNFDPMTLTFDLWPWTRSNSVQNLSEILQSAAELLQFEYLTYDLQHVSRAPLCCGIVCTKFKLSQAILSNVTIFHANTSYHAMTLTFEPLTLKVCGRSGVTWS